jgi:hypothetical protein
VAFHGTVLWTKIKRLRDTLGFKSQDSLDC